MMMPRFFLFSWLMPGLLLSFSLKLDTTWAAATRVIEHANGGDGEAAAASSGGVKDSLTCLLEEEDHPDRVMSLPGYNQPLPSRWFSGYLNYEFEGQDVHTHYIFVEAEDDLGSDDNEATKEEKPLIYWSNGGPGASSMYGLLTELGPFWLSDESLKTDEYRSTGVPTPIYNPYAWSRLGHLLIIDQPAPVGFSYCNNDTSSNTTCSEISWTDELASQNSYKALQTFYNDKAPCLSNLDLYLTGESYGGIYIPTLARQIINDADKEDDSKDNTNIKDSLKGFAVGDGCLGTKTSICGSLSDEGFNDYWHAFFMAGHHQIPWKDFEFILRMCKHSDGPGFLTTPGSQDDEKCRKALQQIKKELGGFFEYALYDDCTYRNGLLKSSQHMAPNERSNHLTASMKGAMNDYPCGGGIVMQEYLGLAEVQNAFHVQSDFFEVDNAVGFDYTPTEPDLTGFYKEILGKLKVLICTYPNLHYNAL